MILPETLFDPLRDCCIPGPAQSMQETSILGLFGPGLDDIITGECKSNCENAFETETVPSTLPLTFGDELREDESNVVILRVMFDDCKGIFFSSGTPPTFIILHGVVSSKPKSIAVIASKEVLIVVRSGIMRLDMLVFVSLYLLCEVLHPFPPC